MSSKVPVKKGVSKDDLKRLMKKMKTEGAINHPLAKYPFLTIKFGVDGHFFHVRPITTKAHY